MKLLGLVLLMISFVGAVDVDMDCPDEIYAGEEFECEVEVEDGEGKYDLKVEVDKDRDSILRIWNGEDWQSGYYYVNDFVRKSEDVRLKIMEDGRYNLIVKLRDGEWKSEFDVGKIRIEAGKKVEIEGTEEEKGNDLQTMQMNADFSLGNGVINLGGDEAIEDVEEWDYVSKDGKVIDWLPYSFCLFLIFLVGVLIWDKGNGYA